MTKTISILQSGYLPYCGFFELISRCDVFVVYDDVAFDKGSWRNRNRVYGVNGPAWMTVPVLQKGKLGQPINKVLINNATNWSAKHLKTLQTLYRKAPYYSEYITWFEWYYSQPWAKLINLNSTFISFVLDTLGIQTEIISSSQIKREGVKTEALVSICTQLGASHYISTNGAKEYLNIDLFTQKGIEVSFQDFNCPQYPQLHKDFIPNLSIVDMLFNCGVQAGKILTTNNS